MTRRACGADTAVAARSAAAERPQRWLNGARITADERDSAAGRGQRAIPTELIDVDGHAGGADRPMLGSIGWSA